jgi:hypothetical protein
MRLLTSLLLQDSIGKAGFDPDQPRDETGKWTAGGGGAAVATATTPARQAERYLRSAEMKAAHVLGGGVCQTFVFELEGGKKAVFKPQNGEPTEPLRRNISPGFSTEREVAAWEVAKIVGMDDLVAPAVERTMGEWHGALVDFQEGEVAFKIDSERKFDGERNLARAAIFDYIIGNEDRHAGNWMVGKDGGLRLIDHNLAFPDKGAYGVSGNHALFNRILIKAEWKKITDPKAKTPVDAATPFLKNKDAILKALKASRLPDAAIAGVAERIDSLKGVKSWSKLYKD